MISNDEIDVEMLIVAVKKHDCIWNYKLKEYSNKIIKNKAWMTVCEEVVSDFNNKSINEKKAIGVDIQSKWKTLRDGFTRYCRNFKKKSGSTTFIPKQYTYYDQLLFLKDVTEGQNDSNFDSQQTCPPIIFQSTQEDSVKKNPRKRQTNSDDIFVKTLTMRLNDKLHKAEKHSSPPPDEDKLFLMSLLSDFKKIPDEWKLDAKGDIIQVIKNYRAMQNYRSISMPSTSQSSYNYMGHTTSSGSPFERNPVRRESQLESNESSSQDSGANTIKTDLVSE